MKRIFKVTGLLLATFLFLVILAVGIIISAVNPNKIKPLIVSQVFKHTNRLLIIDGDVSWSFSPYLGVKIGHMVLSNPPGFAEKIFAEMDGGTVEIKLRPLLHSRVELNGVSLTGIKLHLKDAVIKEFKLQASDVNVDHAFPISSSFVLVTQHPALSMPVSLTGKVTLDLAKQALALNELVGHIANLTVNGEINVLDLSAKPNASGHLKMLPFDLKQWLTAIGLEAANLQAAKKVSGDIGFSTTAFAGLKSIKCQGNLQIEELIAAKLHANKVNIKTNLQDGILNLDPITADFYQGTLQSQVKIDLLPVVPTIAGKANLANVQAEPLLADLWGENKKLKIRGVGNISLQITTAGFTKELIIKNLNGTSQFSIKNGVLDGVNIGYVLDSAYALLKQQPAPPEGEKATNFGSLTGTATIHDGVISNNDLLLDAPKFETKGQGTINLIDQQLSYQLQSIPKQDDLHNIVVPISIVGSVDSPSIRLDVSAVVKTLTKQQVNKVKEKIQEKIHGKAGELLKSLLGN